ncbi:MAG TPA: pyridoxamine 5'-phosphate oxidase family protein [Xanthobacteraceae bacterium]|nr:pyridoxamine 5'-phosphate oxidase family protein [Xanthobacteraceae bacterium]
MNERQQIARAWEIADDVGICMFTTHVNGRMRARPLKAYASEDEGCFWFITDDRGHKDDEIAAEPDVCLSFADTGYNTYLSVTGRAEVLRDRAKLAELWDFDAQAWWPDGPDTPSVRLLRVVPESAEFWDTRGSSIVVAFRLAAARLRGTEPELDLSKKVQMR